MLQLKEINSSRPPLWVAKPLYTLGSGNDQDIRVDGNDKAAQLLIEQEQLFVRPFDGCEVQVNEKPIKEKTQIKSGDHLTVGQTRFLFSDPKQKISAGSAVSTDASWAIQSVVDKNIVFPVVSTATVGRSSSSDIVVSSSRLSRSHAEFEVLEQGLSLKDLDSSNGTFKNGVRITQVTLSAGDVVSFGGEEFVLTSSQVSDDEFDKTTVRSAVNLNHIDMKHQNEHKRKVKSVERSAQSQKKKEEFIHRYQESEARKHHNSEKPKWTGFQFSLLIGILIAGACLLYLQFA